MNAQPANQSDCGHKEYRPFCQMCMATKQKPEQKPYADKANQLNSDKMQIDPVTGDVSIGTPSKQEPVAWMYVNEDGECEQIEYGVSTVEAPYITLLYTAPPSKPWVSLTDEEIDCIWGITKADYEDKFDFPRAIEAALRSKNEKA